jgi:hypothetical protein
MDVSLPYRGTATLEGVDENYSRYHGLNEAINGGDCCEKQLDLELRSCYDMLKATCAKNFLEELSLGFG